MPDRTANRCGQPGPADHLRANARPTPAHSSQRQDRSSRLICPTHSLAAVALGLILAFGLPGLAQTLPDDSPAPLTAPIMPIDNPAPDWPVAASAATDSAAPAADALPHDLSPQGMFLAAHPVVQAVMILLAVASFLTWTVLLFKLVEMSAARRRLATSNGLIRAGSALPLVASALQGRRDPAAFMALAALEEMQRSDPALAAAGTGGVKERVRSIVERIEAQAGRRLRRGTGLLATIGATAPFVGLFGTVWGIMTAFIRIAETRSTNLAVVAPGIAEALLATAIGLVAAIPAVVIYNHFARSIANYRLTLGDAGAGVERLVSRDLDFRTLPGS